MEVNLIILPKKNSDINLGMKRQIRQLFEKLFNDVNDSSFLINIDDNVEIQYKISSKEKNNIIITINNLIKQKMSQVYRLLSHAIL